jgi:hypothetical protein
MLFQAKVPLADIGIPSLREENGMDTETARQSSLKCVFCGKEINPEAAVRYRGALACPECAASHREVKQFNETPFYYAASIGCLVGLVNVLYAMMHALQYAWLGPTIYQPPLELYIALFTISVPLQALGLYALHRLELHKVGTVALLVGLITTLTLVVALFDLITTGPAYTLNETLFFKSFNYYASASALYALFMLVAGLEIILYIGRTKIENWTLAAAAMYLVGGGTAPFSYVVPPFGIVHSITYALAFIYFFTRRRSIVPEPIETVEYQPMATPEA